jgi:hypothetical protein
VKRLPGVRFLGFWVARWSTPLLATFALSLSAPVLAEIRVTIDHNSGAAATRAFHFEHVASPSKSDAATHAKLTLIAGKVDRNGGELATLTDGALPVVEDEPGSNLFFESDTWGGRFRLDLDATTDIAAINTYSWHSDSRAPQLYYVYASDGSAPNFHAAPTTKTDPTTCGWKLLAFVDARPQTGDAGGQYAVSLTDTNGSLGRYRYLLFDVFETESGDAWGNTFYSEIDVVGQ